MPVISADDMEKAYAKANENNYVSKGKAVLALLEKWQHSTRYKLGKSQELNLFEIQETIDAMPTADVQPVVHAYWIELPKALNPNENPCKCSNCGHILSFMNGYPKSKHCDECGAKMDIIYEDDKIRAIKVAGWNNDARNLTGEETDIYNDRLAAETKTIDEISLL